MRSKTKRRALIWILSVAVAFTYLVVVDLGIHAGRIHRGVEVDGGISVGGLTMNEAVEKLTEIGTDLEEQPLAFLTEGFDCRFTPQELGWRARPFATARRALDVGREDALFGAFADRVAAWFGGVTVEWADKPNPRKVGRWVRDCEELGSAHGVRVNKPQLRYRVKRAIVEWPRELVHDLPLL